MYLSCTKLTFAAAVLAALSVACAAPAGEVVCPAVADNSIASYPSEQGDNDGNSGQIKIKGRENQAIMKFDLSGIPKGELVTKAVLSVKLHEPAYRIRQIGISTASVFSLILFNHRVAGMLPRVSYITRIDILLLGGTIIVFVALGETVLTSRLAKIGREELGRSIDRWARWIYLSLVILLLAWVFLF